MLEPIDILIATLASVFAACCAGLLTWTAVTMGDRRAAKARAKPSGGSFSRGDLRALHMSLQESGTVSGKILVIMELIGASIHLGNAGDELVSSYAEAGWPRGLSDNQVKGLPVVLAVFISVIMFFPFLAITPPLVVAAPVFGLCVAYLGVKSWISSERVARQAAINRSMPFVMDLISMSLNAGASFLMVIEMVVVDYHGHPVGEEFRLVLNNIQSGIPAARAMAAFKKRLADLPIACSFADDVIQSVRYGRPLAAILEDASQRYKTMRIQIARERAGKAKVTILVPGILILFGGLLILFGPFAVRFIYQQQAMGSAFSMQ